MKGHKKVNQEMIQQQVKGRVARVISTWENVYVGGEINGVWFVKERGVLKWVEGERNSVWTVSGTVSGR